MGNLIDYIFNNLLEIKTNIVNIHPAYDCMHKYVKYSYVNTIVCPAPQNGIVDCGNGSADMGLDGNNCTFSCDLGYALQGNVTNGICESTGSWGPRAPFCKQLLCEDETEMLRDLGANALPSRLCNLKFQSQCNVSCDEGFIGIDVTYLCNTTNDSTTIVDWMPIGGVDVMCEKGLFIVIRN